MRNALKTRVPKRHVMDHKAAEKLAGEIARESNFTAKLGHDGKGVVIHLMDSKKKRPNGVLDGPVTVRDWADWDRLSPVLTEAQQEAEKEAETS